MNPTAPNTTLWAQNFVPFLLDITLRATLLLGITAFAAALSRRASAAWRHLIWMLGLIAVLGLPLLSGVLPPLTVALPRTVPAPGLSLSAPPLSTTAKRSAGDIAGVSAPSAAARAESVGASLVPAVPAVPAALASSGDTQPRSAVPPTLLLLWGGGAAFVLLQWVAGSIGLRRIFHATSDVPVTGSGKIASAFRAADRSLPGRHRPVRIRVAADPDDIQTPLTWGWRRPVIALPADAGEWTDERLRAALLHELAHVRRRDWPLQRLAHVVCALYWFHPLAWVAARAARAESEKASDDLVLAAGLPATVYADHLLLAARSLPPASGRNPFAPGCGAVAMVSPRMSGIESRLRAVLALNRSRQPLSPRRCGVALVAALLLTAPLATLSPVAAVSPVFGTGAPETRETAQGSQKPLVREADGYTQYITRDFLRAVSPSRNGDVGRIVEFDRAARERSPARIVNGYKTTFTNGFTVEILGLLRLSAQGTSWRSTNLQGWRRPNGSPREMPAIPGVVPGFRRGFGVRSSNASGAGGIAPVMILTRITPPRTGPRVPFSAYQQVLGVAQDHENSWLIPPAGNYTSQTVEVNTPSYPFFPSGAKTFSFRTNIAAGPWKTQAVQRITFTPKTVGKIDAAGPTGEINLLIKLDDSPGIEYKDRSGRWHARYFLPRGQRLGDEARRIVAVDARGNEFPLKRQMSGGFGQPFGVPLHALSFSPSRNPRFSGERNVRLGDIRELRLETRPFQRVEFRNIQIPPQPPVADSTGKASGTTPSMTVVIDAGHGGSDTGATSKTAREKDITLAIARRLRDELAAGGIRVVMTRTDDTFVPIGARGDIAAEEKAACFVSIHCEQKGPVYSVTYHDKSSSGKQLADAMARRNARAFGAASGQAGSDTVRFPRGYGVLRKSSPVSAAVMVRCPEVSTMASPEAQDRTARAIAAGIRDFMAAAR